MNANRIRGHQNFWFRQILIGMVVIPMACCLGVGLGWTILGPAMVEGRAQDDKKVVFATNGEIKIENEGGKRLIKIDFSKSQTPTKEGRPDFLEKRETIEGPFRLRTTGFIIKFKEKREADFAVISRVDLKKHRDFFVAEFGLDKNIVEEFLDSPGYCDYDNAKLECSPMGCIVPKSCIKKSLKSLKDDAFFCDCDRQ